MRNVPEIVDEALGTRPWVKDADVRLREEGHVLCGEAFLVPTDGQELVARLERAGEIARNLDWRIFDLVITVVPDLPSSTDALRASDSVPIGSAARQSTASG